MQTAEQVLEIDGSNTVALIYYGELNPTYRNNAAKRNARKRDAASKETSAASRQVTLNERSPVNFHLAEILSFVVGAACMFGALYVLAFPQIDRNRAEQLEYAEDRLAQVQQDYDDLTAKREQELAEAETNISQFERDIQELSDSHDVLTRTFNIFTAFDLLQEGRLREAADVIGAIETDGLAPDVVERANHIREVVYPQLALTYYNEGVAANNAQDFESALADFERAFYFAERGDPDMLGEVMYFLAWVHSQEAIGNTDMAIQYFERLFEEFPDHPRIPPARQRFEDITS
jgi:tetratricopeptide (TPR) repeat protein